MMNVFPFSPRQYSKQVSRKHAIYRLKPPEGCRPKHSTSAAHRGAGGDTGTHREGHADGVADQRAAGLAVPGGQRKETRSIKGSSVEVGGPRYCLAWLPERLLGQGADEHVGERLRDPAADVAQQQRRGPPHRPVRVVDRAGQNFESPTCPIRSAQTTQPISRRFFFN